MQHHKLPKKKILEIVQKVEQDKNIKLIDFNLNHGAEKGTNYAGIILACDIKVRVSSKVKVGSGWDSEVNASPDNAAGSYLNEYHWIIKLPWESKFSTSRLMHTEEKEIMMYQEIIPAFKRLIHKRKADICFNFCDAPYAEFHKEEEKGSILVLENLKYHGYRDAVDKKKGLNIHYVNAVLTELAKFHAVGYTYIKSFPGEIEGGLRANPVIVRDYFLSNPEQLAKDGMDSLKPMIIGNIIALLEEVQQPGQDFVGSFLKFHKEHDCIDYRDMLYRPKDGEFNTLCHGDTWFNNLLFYHERTKDGVEIPTKAALIDLAMTRWASPCTDLAYFMFMSVSPQLRKTHLSELLQHYHDTLTRSLQHLGEDPAVYPYRQLLKDYDRCRYVGLIMSLSILPLFICREEDALGPDDFEGKLKFVVMFEQMRKAFKDNNHVKAVIFGNFLEMLDNGLLEL